MCWFSIVSFALLHYYCKSAFAQPPLIFMGVGTSPAPPSVNHPMAFIVNNPPNPKSSCSCVLVGTCSGIVVNQGSGTIDIRIVNQGPNPQNCIAGYVYCCTNGDSGNPDANCGKRKIAPSSNKIVGQADYGAYPWQAAILNSANNQYLGAGVLIKDNFVLTAAHKVANLNNGYTVVLGDWNSASNSEPIVTAHPVSTTIHPNFNAQTLENDVAVIKLNQNVPISSHPNINTACLPSGAATAGTRCWTSGWGVNSFTGGQYQTILREVDLPIMDQGACETQLRATRLGQFYQLSKSSFICAGGEAGKDACTGDGGGALVCQQPNGQFQVLGLTAWGIGCAQANVPAAYVNVFNFLSWIKQQIGSPPSPPLY